LLKKLGERRKLLKYLQKEDYETFKEVAHKLNLRIAKKMEKEGWNLKSVFLSFY